MSGRHNRVDVDTAVCQVDTTGWMLILLLCVSGRHNRVDVDTAVCVSGRHNRVDVDTVVCVCQVYTTGWMLILLCVCQVDRVDVDAVVFNQVLEAQHRHKAAQLDGTPPSPYTYDKVLSLSLPQHSFIRSEGWGGGGGGCIILIKMVDVEGS